jgi:hypothetical protein
MDLVWQALVPSDRLLEFVDAVRSAAGLAGRWADAR